MTTTTAGRAVDAGTVRALRLAYQQLQKWGKGSVRSAWRLGQTLDSFSDAYTQLELSEAMELSKSTIARYLRFFRAYQRPELAEQASDVLETFNIDVLTELHDQLGPVDHARPYAGRRFRYRCQHCQSTEVKREEYEPDDDEQPADDERELVGAAAS